MKNEKYGNLIRQKEKKSRGSIVAMVLISISIMVILVVNAFCTLSICRTDITNKVIPTYSAEQKKPQPPMSNSEKVESILLANGLSIIGMAVAVWAGLNIANSINKKEFEETFEKIEKKITSAESKITLLNNESIDVKSTLQDLFLEELLKMPEIDITSKYFYKRFSQVKIPEEVLNFFSKIEQLFYQVYVLHDAPSNMREILIEKTKQGVMLIEKAKEIYSGIDCPSDVAKDLEAYLDYRRAEFEFYKGYESGYQSFISSVKRFEGLVDCFGCKPMPEYNTDFIVPKLTEDSSDSFDLKIYFANTIGEAYSKIIHNYQDVIANHPNKNEEIQICAYKAIFYCKCAVEWSSYSFEKPEVYYRNLGCAYERFDKIFGFGVHSNEILENYKKAFASMKFNERPARIKNVYHTLLSYYNSYFNKKYNLFSKADSFITEMTDKDIVLLKEFYEYSMFAKEHFSKNNLPYVMNGFALSNILKIKRINNECFNELTEEFCLQTMELDLLYLRLLQVKDAYTEELQRRYDNLKNNVLLKKS